MHGRDEECIQNFSQENLKVWNHLGGLEADDNIILKRTLETECDGKD
jgi:hypothetical protein